LGLINIEKKRRNIAAAGNKSIKNEKNKISETKKIDPGNPKNINMLSSVTRKSLGHM
jgi:hypothetical protein